MEQHRIALMFHSNPFIVTSLKTGSSPVVRTTLGLHILQTYFLVDDFLWGYLKDSVYDNNPQTIDALRNNIRTEIMWVPRKMLDRVITISKR